MPARRIVAVVLPELLCELAAEQYLDRTETKRKASGVPLAVVLDPERSEAKINAVNRIARRYGVSVGQTVVEANAFLAQLVVCTVSMDRVRAALSRVAEVAMQFGSVVSIDQEHESSAHEAPGSAFPNTVWIDITGSAHLRGGEQEIAEELHDLVRSLGHEASVAIAGGRAAAAFDEAHVLSIGDLLALPR